MEHNFLTDVFGVFLLPVFILVAFAIMTGQRADALVKGYFDLLGIIAKAIFELLKVAFGGARALAGSNIPQPRPVTRRRECRSTTDRTNNNRE